MLPRKFGVNWPFGSGEEAKNRFSRWRPWRPSWISDRHDFSYFWCTSHPDASYQVSSQFAQGCRSRLLNQCWRRMTDDGHWLTTIVHHEPFALRWANKYNLLPNVLSKNSSMGGKQLSSWCDTAFCSISWGFTMFARDCLAKYIQ